jgi:hypothetical protein
MPKKLTIEAEGAVLLKWRKSQLIYPLLHMMYLLVGLVAAEASIMIHLLLVFKELEVTEFLDVF